MPHQDAKPDYLTDIAILNVHARSLRDGITLTDRLIDILKDFNAKLDAIAVKYGLTRPHADASHPDGDRGSGTGDGDHGAGADHPAG